MHGSAPGAPKEIKEARANGRTIIGLVAFDYEPGHSSSADVQHLLIACARCGTEEAAGCVYCPRVVSRGTDLTQRRSAHGAWASGFVCGGLVPGGGRADRARI